MAGTTLRRLAQSRPYVCRQCTLKASRSTSTRQFTVGRQHHAAKDEASASVLELLEARGYVKEIAGLAELHLFKIGPWLTAT